MRKYIPADMVTIPQAAGCVFEGKMYKVWQWDQELFDGSTTTYEMISRPDSTNVAVIDGDMIVVLDEQQPNRSPFFTLPGGRHDVKGETELEAAQRELFEETGIRAKNWKLVAATQRDSGIDRIVYDFVAWDIARSDHFEPGPGEQMTEIKMNLSQVQDLFRNPKTRYLPEFFKDVTSVEQLKSLPDLYQQ